MTTSSKSTTKPKVILFKNPEDPQSSSPPSYASAFRTRGYDPHFFPVLAHGPVNELELKNVMLHGPSGDDVEAGHGVNEYSSVGGVIVTSARAAEMWFRVAGILDGEGALCPSSHFNTWSEIPFYVVGRSTAQALQPETSHSRYMPSPSLILGAEASGTGEKLAHFILEHYPKHHSSQDRLPPLLHLTGDKTSEGLPNTLKAGELVVSPLQVYETWSREDFTEDLEKIVGGLDQDSPHVWAVFFAPSAAKSTIPILQRYLTLPFLSPATASPLHSPMSLNLPIARIAAIGPTTATFLREKYMPPLGVDVVPAKPEAEALAEAIGIADMEKSLGREG